MSIENDMRNASNEELLDYLKDGFLKNSLIRFIFQVKEYQVTLKKTMPCTLGFGFTSIRKQIQKLRRNSMDSRTIK